MKTYPTFKIVLVLLILSVSAPSMAGKSMGDEPPPGPPMDNPHPPVTESDKKRVAFGEEVLKKILMMDLTGFIFIESNQPETGGDTGAGNFKINVACLANPECLKANKPLVNYVYGLRKMYGLALEFKHTHVIPWAFENFEKNKTSENPVITKKLQAAFSAMSQPFFSKPMPAPGLQNDEYMLHTYVDFNRWYHVDIVLSEDTNGNLEFRRFFILPIPSEDSHMPPGTVC